MVARLALFQYLKKNFPRFNNDNILYDSKSLLYPHLAYSVKELRKNDNIQKRCLILMSVADFIKHREPD